MQRLEVVARALLEPLRFQKLPARPQLAQSPPELIPDRLDRLLESLLRGDKVLRRVDRGALHVAQKLAGQGIELGDALDLVAPEVHAQGRVVVGGEDRQRVAADAEPPALGADVVALVLHRDQLAHERGAVHPSSAVEAHHEGLVLPRLPQSVDARHGSDDDHVPPLEERASGRVPHLVDLVVYVRVLRDVGVAARDVRLRLVVVVVGDEVLHGVVREEVAELRDQLGGERAIGSEHERRLLPLGDHVRHGEGLPRAGDAEQRLGAVAAVEAREEARYRLRLVARRSKVGDEL